MSPVSFYRHVFRLALPAMSFIQPERRQPVVRQLVLGMTCLSTLNLEELNRDLLARVLIGL